ncbi:MAG TPA: DoxX family protein [Verrucomicrobiae bacterium]|nr:DoxX family protein [Verrucomicrobiae bacterium]
MKFLKNFEPLASFALRAVLALIFLSHGYPKLVHPTPAMRDFFIAHGLPGYFLHVAGILESFGAVLLFIGLFTRPVALLLAIEMSVAIWKVHSVHGIMSVKDYEFPLALAAACFALATVGAGLLSADHVVFGEDSKKRRITRTTKSSKD